MTIRNFLSEFVGAALIAAAFAWLSLDVKADTHVAMSTAAGSTALALVGGWFISKTKTLELVKFVAEQLRALRVAVLSPVGSDSEK